MQYLYLFRKTGSYLSLPLLCLLFSAGLYAAGESAPNDHADLHSAAHDVRTTATAAYVGHLVFTCDNLSCQGDYEVDCIADAAVPDPPAPNDLPNAGDDRCSVTNIEYTDHIDSNPADPAYSAVITRTWSALVNGTLRSCEQIIRVKTGQEPVVTAPADINDLSCEDSTDPSNTGEATASDANGPVEVTFEDEVINELGADCYTIKRTWTATNDCGTGQAVQMITVTDTEDPEFVNCPRDITVDRREDVPDVPSHPNATDNCDTDVTVVYNGEQEETSGGVTTITRSWTATDNCENTTTCEQKITVRPDPKLVNDCYSLSNERSYNPDNNTTTFVWELCLVGEKCKDISNIRFSLPCGLPGSAVKWSSSSQRGLVTEIDCKSGYKDDCGEAASGDHRRGRKGKGAKGGSAGGDEECLRCDLNDTCEDRCYFKYEAFRDGAIENAPDQCITFTYVIKGNVIDHPTDVIIKAGTQTGMDFCAVPNPGAGPKSATSTARGNSLAGQSPLPSAGPSDLAYEGHISQVAVFPNPARDLISLRFESVKDQRVNLQVYDATGRVAFSRALDAAPGSNTVELSLGDVPAGLYQMVLTPAVGERTVRSFLRLQ